MAEIILFNNAPSAAYHSEQQQKTFSVKFLLGFRHTVNNRLCGNVILVFVFVLIFVFYFVFYFVLYFFPHTLNNRLCGNALRGAWDIAS